MRDRGWRRKKDFAKAKRKKNIDLAVSFYSYKDYNNPYCSYRLQYGMYDNLHEYSKNKIHCSCGLCTAKTRNKGRKRNRPKNYMPSINYDIHDKRRIDSMNDEVKDCIYGEE